MRFTHASLFFLSAHRGSHRCRYTQLKDGSHLRPESLLIHLLPRNSTLPASAWERAEAYAFLNMPCDIMRMFVITVNNNNPDQALITTAELGEGGDNKEVSEIFKVNKKSGQLAN